MSSFARSLQRAWLRAQFSAARLLRDNSAVAAVEFGFLVPVLMVMFWGTVEYTSAISAKRKVTVIARTMSDLTSQGANVSTADLGVYFAIGQKILNPYDTTSLSARVSEIYINPNSGAGDIQWSWVAGTGYVALSGTVTVPTALISRDPNTNAILPNQYLIFSESKFLYQPVVGYVMAKAGITLSDSAYTRPRQTTCVFFPSIPSPAICPTL